MREGSCLKDVKCFYHKTEHFTYLEGYMAPSNRGYKKLSTASISTEKKQYYHTLAMLSHCLVRWSSAMQKTEGDRVYSQYRRCQM